MVLPAKGKVPIQQAVSSVGRNSPAYHVLLRGLLEAAQEPRLIQPY